MMRFFSMAARVRSMSAGRAGGESHVVAVLQAVDARDDDPISLGESLEHFETARCEGADRDRPPPHGRQAVAVRLGDEHEPAGPVLDDGVCRQVRTARSLRISAPRPRRTYRRPS